MLNVVMLNVILLNVVVLNVILLNVIMVNVILLSVVMLNVAMLNVVMLNVVAPKHRVSTSEKKVLQLWVQVSRADFKPDEDPTQFKSVKTGRGPLTGDWKEQVTTGWGSNPGYFGFSFIFFTLPLRCSGFPDFKSLIILSTSKLFFPLQFTVNLWQYHHSVL
jgi:hypothetical protein